MAGDLVQPTLLGLPAELLQHILAYLEPLELANVAQVCTTLSAQSYDDQIWLPLINQTLSEPITDSTPCKTFRELYIAHHPHWFLTRQKLWFADSEPSGKLIMTRYDPGRGCIEAYAVTAQRGHHTLEFWEKDRDVIIHSFNPRLSLDKNQPVLRLCVDSMRTDDQPGNHPSDRGYAPPSRYSKEILMETFAEAGLYGSFMLCRAMPKAAISDHTRLWPPLRFPADARVRNDSRDGYSSAGHRPSRLSEVSHSHFRLRKWVEYTGRRSSPSLMSFSSPNGLAAALGMNGPYFAANLSSSGGGGMSIRMPEDIATYTNLPDSILKPTSAKPYQGLWIGDYSGHGCEFLVIVQPDKEDEKPLPEGMDWLRNWFRGGRRGSVSSDDSYTSAQEELDYHEAALQQVAPERMALEMEAAQRIVDGFTDVPYQRTVQEVTDFADVPSGRLEAIKITGDPNVPRGEYTFIVPDVGHGGFMRVADEEIFRGARVVRSAGHIAGRGFREDQYTPSQLMMISTDRLAQFWEGFGHISYYQRVDLEALKSL